MAASPKTGSTIVIDANGNPIGPYFATNIGTTDDATLVTISGQLYRLSVGKNVGFANSSFILYYASGDCTGPP
jgi:hypothetical protein